MAAANVFADFNNHFSKTRVSTETQLLASLREKFPEHHVTIIDKSECDLIGFAEAGYAKSTLHADDEYHDATRSTAPDAKRNAELTLLFTHRFARYEYVFDVQTFTVFYSTYLNRYQQVIKIYYVLAPRDAGTITSGVHSATEELMRKASHWTRQLHKEVWVFDSAYWRKSKDLYKSVQNSSWDDLIINDRLKQNLMSDVLGFFESKDLYHEYGVPWKRGIILHGLPGNGKTMCIKSLMNSLHQRPDPIPTLYVKSLRSCDGPEYSARLIFKQARRMAPCMLVLEDLDSLINDKVRTFFLNEVDGLEDNDGILIIGSTNYLTKLDPAISKRPSRFDRKFRFALPVFEDRIAYCRYWMKKVAKNPKLDFPDEICPLIAQATEGFSFAYMKELFIAALLQSARGNNGEEPQDDSSDSYEEIEKEETEVEADEPDVPAQKEQEDTSGESQKSKGPQKERKKRQFPILEIPASMQDNAFLKLVIQQAETLMKEMDSTDPEEWKSSKVARRKGDQDNEKEERPYWYTSEDEEDSD